MDLFVVITGTFWVMYSVVTTVVLILGAKDRVLTKLWTFTARVRVLRRGSPKDFFEDIRKEDSGYRLTVCREISELLISQLVGWTTLSFLMSNPEALTEVFAVPKSYVYWTTTSTSIDGRASFAMVLLCIQVGRMSFRTYYHTFVKFHPAEFIHSAILTLSYAAFLLPGVSTAVALVGIAGDVADFHLRASKIMDARGVPCYSKSRIQVYGVGVATTFAGRCFMPLALVVAALTFGSDPVQDLTRSGLALFTFFLTYLTAVNVFLGLNALSRFNEARSLRRLYVEAMRDNSKTLELALSMRLRLYETVDRPLTKKPLFLGDLRSVSVTLP